VWRTLTFQDRAQIAVGLTQGLSDRQIGALLERDHTSVWRERGRNSLTSGVYKPASADFKAADARHRPQVRAVDADPVLRAQCRLIFAAHALPGRSPAGCVWKRQTEP
jgi:IS30 family transposase